MIDFFVLSEVLARALALVWVDFSAGMSPHRPVLLRFHPDIAPFQVAVLPLSKKDTLSPTARSVYDVLRQNFNTQYDDTQSIGRRYRRQDEIGTPLCVTVDFDTLDDDAVTIRNRDTMEQIRVPIENLEAAIRDQMNAMRIDCQG